MDKRWTTVEAAIAIVIVLCSVMLGYELGRYHERQLSSELLSEFVRCLVSLPYPIWYGRVRCEEEANAKVADKSSY